MTLYSVESVKAGVAGERLVAVDGGMSDNLRPMLYGASYEAHVVTRMGADGRRRAAWSASTASPATCSCATPSCPTRAPAT